MPTENDKPAKPDADVVKQDDGLASELKKSKDRVSDLENQLKDALSRVKQVEKKNLELAKSAAPEGDHVVFEGKTYAVKGAFRADNTFAEVKRGHCEEGCTLIAIERQG